MAYREGFVCHKHSEHREGPDGESEGYHFRDDGSSQHCIGALYMYLQQGDGNIPWERAIEEDPKLEERWWGRADLKILSNVFESEDVFIEANA